MLVEEITQTFFVSFLLELLSLLPLLCAFLCLPEDKLAAFDWLHLQEGLENKKNRLIDSGSMI